MSEEIEFESIPEKIAPVIPDTHIEQIREKAIAGIEKKQIEDQEKIKAGIKTVEDVDVPKELPQLIFHYASKAISCPKMETDETENKIIAKHLTIIASRFIKASWQWSLIVIFIIIIGKISQCSTAVSRFFGKKKSGESDEHEQKDVGGKWHE